MIARIATSRRHLSSLSLIFSLSPEARAIHFSYLVTLAVVVVAVGVAFEAVELTYDGFWWIKRKRLKRRELADLKEVAEVFPAGTARHEEEAHSDHPRWVKFFQRIGLILVVIGVVGEWRWGSELEEAHNDIHRDDMALLNDAKTSAQSAAGAASRAQGAADTAVNEVTALAPRNISIVDQRTIAVSLHRFGHPSVSVASYGLDGEGRNLAAQIKSIIHSATGLEPIDGGTPIVAGGFEIGVSIRGPDSELPFMNALRSTLISPGKLEQVTVNGPAPPIGAGIGGSAGIGGNAGLGGGGGPPRPQAIPTSGPVRIFVGIRPIHLLPIADK